MSRSKVDNEFTSNNNTFSFFLCRLLESSKSAISERTFAERSAKLWEAQSAIDDLLMGLEEKQRLMSDGSVEQMEKKKCTVKLEPEFQKVERKPTLKSLFHGTSMSSSTPTQAANMESKQFSTGGSVDSSSSSSSVV